MMPEIDVPEKRLQWQMCAINGKRWVEWGREGRYLFEEHEALDSGPRLGLINSQQLPWQRALQAFPGGRHRSGGNAKHFNNESKNKIPKRAKKKKKKKPYQKWRKNLSKAAKHTHLDTGSECVCVCVWRAVSHFMLTTFLARSVFHQEANVDDAGRPYHHFVYH